MPNFDGPTEFGGAINAPSSYIGMKYYPGIYNPAQCAAACQATTAYDMKHAPASGKYDACVSRMLLYSPLVLTLMCRTSSTPMCFLSTTLPKVLTAPCTRELGIGVMLPILGNTAMATTTATARATGIHWPLWILARYDLKEDRHRLSGNCRTFQSLVWKRGWHRRLYLFRCPKAWWYWTIHSLNRGDCFRHSFS